MKGQGVGGGVSFPSSYEKTTPTLTYYGFLFRLSLNLRLLIKYKVTIAARHLMTYSGETCTIAIEFVIQGGPLVRSTR